MERKDRRLSVLDKIIQKIPPPKEVIVTLTDKLADIGEKITFKEQKK